MLRDHDDDRPIREGGLAFRRFSCVVCWGMLSTMLREDDHHHHQGGLQGGLAFRRFSCVCVLGRAIELTS